MSMTNFDKNVNIISSLSDEPNSSDGLTADELKAKFDAAVNLIKDYINNTQNPAIDAALALKADKSYVDARTTDYIVEQGTSGIWAYRKWNSGKFDMCGIFDNASNGMTINLPFAVVALYGSFVCGHYNTSTSVASFYSFDFNNGATSGILHALDPSGSARTISTLSGQIYINGRYK